MSEGGRLDAVVHIAVAFDVGYEIDLDRARSLLSGETGALPRRRGRTPESIRYRPAPVRLAIDGAGLRLPGAEAIGPTRTQLSLFDFGAVSLLASFPVVQAPSQLLELAGELADTTALTTSARCLVAPFLERIRPAIDEFDFRELVEEYVIFQLGPVHEGWLSQQAAWIAGLIRLETGPLGSEEVHEATRLGISYAPNDLVVLDWAAGLIADRECEDTLQVIEFANLQLLEFRHIDDQLDDRLEAAYRLIRPVRTRHLGTGWRTHLAAVRRVRELEIEATSLFERADNALKLIGDQYLARVYGLASTRFHLREWEQSIRQKLDTVGDVYDLLVEQASGRRMEALEVIVVVLIAVEVVLALVRH